MSNSPKTWRATSAYIPALWSARSHGVLQSELRENQDYPEMLERCARHASSLDALLTLAGGPLGFGKGRFDLLNPYRTYQQ